MNYMLLLLPLSYGMAACRFCFSVILWCCQCLRLHSVDGTKREINDQIARIWKVMVVTGTSMYYPSTLLERLRKTTRSLNQDSTLTNIQTGHPPNKILQHYYYRNVIGKVGWNKQPKHLRNWDKWTLFRALFFAPHNCRPGSKNRSNKQWLQAFHTRRQRERTQW